MSQLTLTVDTTDTLVLSEASLMLQRIASELTAITEVTKSATCVTKGVHDLFTSSDADLPLPPVTVAFDTAVAQAVASIPEPELEQPYIEGELDSAGMPWDERIHTTTKSKVKDGTWMFKRGLDEVTKQAVLAEYNNVGLDDTVPTPISETIVTPKVEATYDASGVPINNTPPPPAVESEEGITTLPQFLKAVRARGISPQQVQEACAIVGAANPISLGQNQAQLIEAAELLGL